MNDLNIPFISFIILYFLVSTLGLIYIIIHPVFKHGVRKKDFKKLGYSKSDIDKMFLQSEELINDLAAFNNTDFKTQIIKLYGLPQKIKDLKNIGIDIDLIEKPKRREL